MLSLRIIVLAGVALGVSAALAQSDNAQPDPEVEAMQERVEAARNAPCIPTEKLHQVHIIYKDRPYSATRVARCEVRLKDGTVYQAKRITLEWRDSEGRTRYESPERIIDEGKTHHIVVTDPVKHISWTWDTGEHSDKTAVMVRYKPAVDFVEPEINRNIQRDGSVDPPILARMAQPVTPTSRQDILKPTYINGVWAEGDRLTQIVDQSPDHKAKMIVNEFWVSVELMEEVRHIADDPEQGKTDDELIDIDMSQPDPALFRPPPGYGILDATPRVAAPARSPLIVIPVPPKNEQP